MRILRSIIFIIALLIGLSLGGCTAYHITTVANLDYAKIKSQHKKPQRVRVALALGGGGARGYATLGVLRVLQNRGVPIDLIAGTVS